MNMITLPNLSTQKDIDNLVYPNDITMGVYVYDTSMKSAILITDSSSAEIHQRNPTDTSRTRFATKKEIRQLRNETKFPHYLYNTVVKWRAYNYATVIYNL